MSTVVILGNGFDIWNKLPTSYWHFFNQYNALLNEYLQYFDDFCDLDAEWANFEESLGSFNQDNFHDNVTWQPSLEELADNPTCLYGFEDEISNKKDELVAKINNAFKTWIASVDVSLATPLIGIPTNLNFINFNYTTTLQDVYGVPDESILHIHGKVRRDIIFGHGRASDSSEGFVRNENEPWFEDSQRNASSIPEIFYKPVEQILENNRAQLEGYGDVTEIIVIGHSINEIDIPYFQCLLAAYPDAHWRNYNYENLDEDIDAVSETHSKLLSLGVPSEKLTSSTSEALKTIYPLT